MPVMARASTPKLAACASAAAVVTVRAAERARTTFEVTKCMSGLRALGALRINKKTPRKRTMSAAISAVSTGFDGRHEPHTHTQKPA